MEALPAVLVVLVMAGLPVIGIPLTVIAIGAFDFPPGSREVAGEFLSGGGWALLVVLGLIGYHVLSGREA